MQNLLIKESLPETVKGKESSGIFPWGRLGPTLLLGAFAAFLFRSAPTYWPLTLTAFFGYAVICMSGKKGLWFSTAALCCVFVFMPGAELFWTMLLGLSIAISWVLIYLGGLEAEAFAASCEERIQALEKEKLDAVKQLREVKGSLSVEQDLRAREKQRVEVLLSENAKVQSRIAEFSDVLEKNAKLQKVDETTEEEKVQLEQLQYQFAVLRGQFDEKSDALNQARKDLFKLENEFIALQMTMDEKKYEPPAEDAAYLRDLKSLEEKCRDLENQEIILQDVISTLLLPKKRPSPKKRKNVTQELLPGL